MELIAFASFGVLVVAWLVAPSKSDMVSIAETKKAA